MKQLDLQRLEKKLWDCANVLRGELSSAEYKDYIFGLLFLKRMNDQFYLEREKLVEEYKKEGMDDETIEALTDDASIYDTFYVPDQARWSKLKDLNLNIGPELDKAFKSIEDEPKNFELVGVLSTANYNDKERVPDSKLNQLIQIFDSMNLSNEGLEKPDILGDAYMYLIKMFADDGGKKGGEFYTPDGVKQVMVRILDPKETDSIYDPTVGSAGFLISCLNHVKEQGGNYKKPSIIWTRDKPMTWAIAKINMLLHEAKGAIIWKGDTIRDPKSVENGTLMTFDKVIANPPFSLKNWGREIAETNKYNRFNYGLPPKSYGDLAFVEHMISSMNSKGKMATVVPHGVLFRGGAEGKIRKMMLDDDLFEAVIGLPPNLFYGTGIPAAIIVMNKDKPEEKINKVLFIDASSGFEKDGNQNKLTEENMEKMVEVYENYEDVDKYASIIDLDEIAENDYNLNIARYVDTTEPEEIVDIDDVVSRIAKREEKLAESKEQINEFLEELGFGGDIRRNVSICHPE